LSSFEVLGKVIWKDLRWEEDWEGFNYGLKFVQLLEEDRGKLKQILSRRIILKEVSYHA
jgi:hypothetical protein